MDGGAVVEILGHSQIAVTMNIYTHVVQDTQREAVSHLDRMLKRRPVVNDSPG
ncbi:integrase [Streptomyces sp. NBC_00322]|uniref:integrase n=1 Tax=Streptomyces sp. NBC_00322 TaxID=2975712 RepID=UPI002E2988DE|nr:integrase [Streptomyces sp. NBC_00322]